ncbi:hypothetical protein ACFXCZ_30595 [Streptomyces sp. NPDC059396]|uniref:hypothetical protein n=1 Tax=Streptomyces sp. NPDC059396 TaxID=3346819 RepID=UPI0036C1EA98
MKNNTVGGPMKAGSRARGASALGAIVLLWSALAACSTAAPADPADARRQVPDWAEDATPASVSRQLGVKIPAKATDRRAAYQNGFQDDGLLLAFTLPTPDVDAFIGELAPENALTQRDKPLQQSFTPTTPFSHLSLAEPETLPEVREGQVCAPCEGQLNSLQIAVHPLDDRNSRVYLRGVD